jgi:hypothetical protein
MAQRKSDVLASRARHSHLLTACSRMRLNSSRVCVDECGSETQACSPHSQIRAPLSPLETSASLGAECVLQTTPASFGAAPLSAQASAWGATCVLMDPGCAGGQCSASVPRRWPGHARADRGAPGPAPALRAGLPHRLCAEGRRAVHLPPGAQPAAPGAASGADRAVVWWWVRPAVCTCIWLGFIQAQALALTSTCVVGIPVHVLHLPVIVLIQAESSLRDLSGASSAGPLQRGGLVPA